ncbi:MAG: hypothetical protein H7197_00975 [Vitreoscilla sp.]|nr:hypothetical protein [Polaromonas sp.]
MTKNYSIWEASGTVGAAVIRAGLLLSIAGTAGPFNALEPLSQYKMLEPSGTASKTNDFYFVSNLTEPKVGLNFEKSISSFYQKLQTSQEPLGDEFERVLAMNRWDLYTHT